jgi:hypothetical protein
MQQMQDTVDNYLQHVTSNTQIVLPISQLLNRSMVFRILLSLSPSSLPSTAFLYISSLIFSLASATSEFKCLLDLPSSFLTSLDLGVGM